MAKNGKAPALRAGASEGTIVDDGRNLSLARFRAQIVMAGYHVRPELAGMLAALAFGGGAHG